MAKKTTLKHTFKDAENGIAMLVRVAESDKMQTVLVIKEEQKYIDRLGHLPVFDSRLGYFKRDNVSLVVLTMLVNGDADMLYETYFNYCDDSITSSGSYLDLRREDELRIVFLNEAGEDKRNFRTNNPYKQLFADTNVNFEGEKWSMEEFDSLKEYVCDEYTSPMDLFNHLKEQTN